MVITNNTRNKQEIHGVKNTVAVMPGQVVTVKEKDIPKHEIERISSIMKVESDTEKVVNQKQDQIIKEGK